MLITRPNRGIFWSKEELHKMDCVLFPNDVHSQFVASNFLTDYSVKIYYKRSLFFMDFVQTVIHQEINVNNLGQKLLYSNFHAWKKKKKKHHPYKKARCKIFNSYKNINMNKLISSTFLYCPTIYPMFFQQMEKKLGKRRKWVLYILSKEALLSLPSPSLL